MEHDYLHVSCSSHMHVADYESMNQSTAPRKVPRTLVATVGNIVRFVFTEHLVNDVHYTCMYSVRHLNSLGGLSVRMPLGIEFHDINYNVSTLPRIQEVICSTPFAATRLPIPMLLQCKARQRIKKEIRSGHDILHLSFILFVVIVPCISFPITTVVRVRRFFVPDVVI